MFSPWNSKPRQARSRRARHRSTGTGRADSRAPHLEEGPRRHRIHGHGRLQDHQGRCREGRLDREHFTRELSKPHVAAYMREKVLKQLAIAAARAGAVEGELLDIDNDNDMVRDRASTFVLGLADIAPASALSVDIDKSWLRHRPHG
jgi:hypothetical protein